jgi:enoyl-CoA hydratase
MKQFRGNVLSWDFKNGILELALHRPPANEMGALTLSELEQFVAALESLGAEANTLIIYSQLKSGFGAGGDLNEMYARLRDAGPIHGFDELRDTVERSHRVLNAIDTAPVVVIAAVHGICFGGAFELALTSDLIVADKSARFCFPELRLGLIPGGGGIPRLKRDLRNGVARDLLFTGRSINAEKAHSLGLVSQVSSEGEVLQLARSMASEINKFDAAARIAAKRFIKPVPLADLRDEIKIFCDLFTRPAAMDGLRKFVKKPGALPYLP